MNYGSGLSSGLWYYSQIAKSYILLLNHDGLLSKLLGKSPGLNLSSAASTPGRWSVYGNKGGYGAFLHFLQSRAS